jgi:hypothetical protein
MRRLFFILAREGQAMAKVKTPPNTTASRIYRHYDKPQEERTYIGASMLGNECRRAVWYKFRWAHPPEDFSPRMLRLFDTGQREEARIINDLRAEGVSIFGQQQEFNALGGHLCGHIDGIAGGLPETPKTLHVLEIKTHNDKSFKALLVDGVRKSKPMHYVQMMLYMHYLDYKRALYVAVNKNDDSIYTERFEYDKRVATYMIDVAQTIIQAPFAPPKLHENPDAPAAYACSWCPAKGVCHDRQPARRNCRTCLSSSALVPQDASDAPWYCDHWKKLLTLDEQRAGCPEHRYIPDLVAGRQVDADPDKRTVTYQMDGGREWTDGLGKI